MDLLVDVQLHGFVKEVEEVLPGPGRATLAEHLAGFYVERSEQVRRAVPHVVVGLLLRLPAVQLQRRLDPVQRLDLLGRGRDQGRVAGGSFTLRSGRTAALLRRSPLRTVRATRHRTRLKQAAGGKQTD